MGVSGGPNVVTDGLVLDLDAANAQSYPNYYNLMLNTQTFSSGSYAGQGLNTTGNPAWVNVGTAPDGTNTSFALIPTSGSALHRFYYTFQYISGSVYTFSCYAKAGNRTQFAAQLSFTALGSNWRTATFNLVGTGSVASSNGNAGVSPTIINVGNGWYRCTFTNICTTNSSDQLAFGYNCNNYNGDGTTDIEVWGAQMNLGTTALPYQQVTTYPTRWLDLSPTFASSSLINGSYYNIYSIPTKAMTFDGVDDYTTCAPYKTGNNNLTISLWSKIITALSGDRVTIIFGKDGTTNECLGLYYRASSNYLRVTMWGADPPDYNTSFVKDTNWHNDVMVYNNNTVLVYRDGVADANGAQSRTLNFTLNRLLIGAALAASTYANVSVSNVIMYNRALSASEILQNYNATKTRFGL